MLPAVGAIIGSGIGAVGSLAGAAMSNAAAGQMSEQDWARQQHIFNLNANLQKEFAQHGIRWKMADAQAAGIHPLAALGAQTQSFSPISIGTGAHAPDMGGAVAEFSRTMGQGIERAAHAQVTQEERTVSQLRIASMEQDVIGKQLQNSILRNQLAPGTPPGLPSNSGLPGSLVGAGQGDAYVVEKPLTATHSAKGAPYAEVGSVNDVGWARTSTGGLAPIPSQDVKQRIEDQIIPETLWSIRNNLVPSLGLGTPPPRDVWPKGARDMKWNPALQEWRPVFKGPEERPDYQPGRHFEGMMGR